MNNEVEFDWIEFAEVNGIIRLLASTNSKNEKMAILEKHKDNIMLQQVLYYTYNDLKYKISLDAVAKAKASEDKAPICSPFALCQELAKSNINDDLRAKVKSYIQYTVPKDCRDLVLNMLLKDQGIRMTSKTINKVIPNLIPEFKCMLGNPVKKAKLKESDWIAITQKMNGIRAVFCYDDFRSRQGKVIEGFDCIKQDLYMLYEELGYNVLSLVFDGELVQINKDNAKNDEDNFRESLSIVNSKERTKEDEAKIEYVLFDIVPTDEFFEGESRKKYKARREILDQIQEICDRLELQHLRVVPCYYMGKYSKKVVDETLAKTDALELEGVMINKNAPYVTKRTSNLLKVKSFFFNDVYCLDIYEGEGEFVGMLGGITTNYKGYKVNCGSGFTQEQRKYYWEHKDEIVGKIVTIKCKGESRNSKNDDLSMNFPIFTEVRLDKDSESYES